MARVEKNLSYIPLPNPIRFASVSTPTTGTIATSIFFIVNNELFGSLTPKLPSFSGRRYVTILKLSLTINGT